jgi:hypothetical protein
MKMKTVGSVLAAAVISALIAIASGQPASAADSAQQRALSDVCRMPSALAQPGVPFFGTPGPDVIGAAGPGVIVFGRGGNDIICTSGGDDTIRGGAGNDIIFGFGGDDVIRGGGGNDRILGGGGDDDIRGGGGRDRIDSGAGLDTVTGQAGVDICTDPDFWISIVRCEDALGRISAGGGVGRESLFGVADAGIQTTARFAVSQIRSSIGRPSSTGSWIDDGLGRQVRTLTWDNLWVDLVREPGRQAILGSAYLAGSGRYSGVGGLRIGATVDRLTALFPRVIILEVDQGTLWYVPSWSEFLGDFDFDLASPTLYGFIANGRVASVVVGAPASSPF